MSVGIDNIYFLYCRISYFLTGSCTFFKLTAQISAIKPMMAPVRKSGWKAP